MYVYKNIIFFIKKLNIYMNNKIASVDTQPSYLYRM